MFIKVGLFNDMVLQRVRGDVCDADIRGLTKNEGDVVVRVTRASGRAVAGFAGKRIGKAKKGKFSARLKGLPVGGPYDIRLSVNDEQLLVKNVLVGDVWILGGQSNMDGFAFEEPPIEPNDMVRAFYPDDHWATAIDPIHTLHLAVDSVHAMLGAASLGEVKGAFRVRGPGISFGIAMRKETGIPQGLIACAHSGTSMSQWSQSLKKLKGKSLYGATLRRFEKNGSKIAGIFWYQGCSDANEENASEYTGRMKKLISAFRRDMKKPKLPFVLAQLATFTCFEAVSPQSWNSIQEQQRLLPNVIDNCLTVPTIDLPLDDGIHISGVGHIVLGTRFADAMLALTGMVKGHKKPIEFGGFRIFEDKYQRGWNIEVSFKNVVGELQAQGLPTGFNLSTQSGKAFDGIYRTELKGNKVILFNNIPMINLQQWACSLHYGLGFSPYCNITDSSGRSLPAMGPIRLFEPKAAVTPFVLDFAVSKLLPYSGNLDEIKHPDLEDYAFGWINRHFNDAWFAERHLEIQDTAPQNVCCYFVTDMICGEDMTGELLVGYDGPVKVWLDGKVIIKDTAGMNPGLPDKSKVKVSLKAGQRYRIAIALDSNKGKAWGISMRFLRHGVLKSKLRKGPQAYKMPVFVLPDLMIVDYVNS